jgi:pimeloyl-ACP methyl ester carboxylesterase
MIKFPDSLVKLILLVSLSTNAVPGTTSLHYLNHTRMEDTILTVRSKDGVAISSHKSGEGSPLVLVHGAVADHTRWSPIIPQLKQGFTVYAMDRRGRGSSGDAGIYSIEREFEDIAAVVDAIDQPVNLLGHSFGALCALEAALLTDNIKMLILYEPPPPALKGTLPTEVAGKMQELLDSGDRGGVVSTFLLNVAKIPRNELDVLRSLPAWQGRVAAAHTILREITQQEALPPFKPDRFKNLNIPILLMLGGESHPLYADFIKQLDATLPNSRIVVMPGQQHVAMNTAPDLFVAEVHPSWTFGYSDPLFAKAMEEAIISSMVNNPRVMRSIPGLLARSGWKLLSVTPHLLAEIGKGSFFLSAMETYGILPLKFGLLPETQVNAWLDEQRSNHEEGVFFASGNYYTYMAERIE